MLSYSCVLVEEYFHLHCNSNINEKGDTVTDICVFEHTFVLKRYRGDTNMTCQIDIPDLTYQIDISRWIIESINILRVGYVDLIGFHQVWIMCFVINMSTITEYTCKSVRNLNSRSGTHIK